MSVAGPPYAFQATIGDARIAGVESTVEWAPVDVQHKASLWNALPLDKRVLQPGYSLVNVRLDVGNGGGAWRAEGYVTHVANKRTVVYEDTTGYDYYPGIFTPQLATPPRVMGLRLSYHW